MHEIIEFIRSLKVDPGVSNSVEIVVFALVGLAILRKLNKVADALIGITSHSLAARPSGGNLPTINVPSNWISVPVDPNAPPGVAHIPSDLFPWPPVPDDEE